MPEIQSLGYALARAAKETQKVTSDLYFEEAESRRPGILQSQKDVQKVLNSQSMKEMSTTLRKQFFFPQLLENIDLFGTRLCLTMSLLTAG